MKLNLISKKIAVLTLFSFYNVSIAQSTGGNPVINNDFLGDPAAMVHKGKVYLYAGHDEAPDDFHFYKMNGKSILPLILKLGKNTQFL